MCLALADISITERTQDPFHNDRRVFNEQRVAARRPAPEAVGENVGMSLPPRSKEGSLGDEFPSLLVAVYHVSTFIRQKSVLHVKARTSPKD